MLPNRNQQNNDLNQSLLSAVVDNHVIDIPKRSDSFYLTDLIGTLQEAKAELKTATDILEMRFAKKYVPLIGLQIMLQMIFIVTIISSIRNMMSSASLFNVAMTNYYNTIEPKPWGWDDQPLPCGGILPTPVGSDNFYSSDMYDRSVCQYAVNLLNSDENTNCGTALDAVCNSPNMWSGYLLTIISLGIIVPGLLSMLSLGVASSFNCFNLFEQRATLSREDRVYLGVISDAYSVGFEANGTHGENLKLFEDMIYKIDEVIKLVLSFNKNDRNYINSYAKRHSLTPFTISEFLLEKNDYVINHFKFILEQRNKKLERISLHSAINEEVAELSGGLEQHIGEYAGSGVVDEWVNPVLETLLQATHSKNEKSKLHAFFKGIDKLYNATHVEEIREAQAAMRKRAAAGQDTSEITQRYQREQAAYKRQLFNRIALFAGLKEQIKYPLTAKPRQALKR